MHVTCSGCVQCSCRPNSGCQSHQAYDVYKLVAFGLDIGASAQWSSNASSTSQSSFKSESGCGKIQQTCCTSRKRSHWGREPTCANETLKKCVKAVPNVERGWVAWGSQWSGREPRGQSKEWQERWQWMERQHWHEQRYWLGWMSILSQKVTWSMLLKWLQELEWGPLMQQSGLLRDVEVMTAAAALKQLMTDDDTVSNQKKTRVRWEVYLDGFGLECYMYWCDDIDWMWVETIGTNVSLGSWHAKCTCYPSMTHKDQVPLLQPIYFPQSYLQVQNIVMDSLYHLLFYWCQATIWCRDWTPASCSTGSCLPGAALHHERS